jgi:microcin C transport system substrate-binding protein
VPAVAKGWLKKEEVPHELPTGMQGFVFNTRRDVFSDPKVREALAYAFDFEWTNQNLFFGQYSRTRSYFSNSPQAATGLPEGEELEILEQFREQIPRRVFTTPYQPPSTDGSGWPRDNLRTAFRLLEEAGWVVRDMRLVNEESGRAMTFEILLVSQAFERIILPFVNNLRRLGIDARVRLVDQSQYINRLRSFDFDVIVFVWGQSDTPGNEQREYWSSQAADNPASRNFAGIRDPVVDRLIELLIQSDTREQLNERTRALDRVLQYGFYVIPNWHLSADRVLWWDKFSRPSVPVRTGVLTDRWWYDETKAQRLTQARARDTSLTEDADEEPSRPWTLVAIAVLLAAGWVLVRNALRRRG